MKEKRIITLQEAWNLVNNCSAVIIDDDALVYPSMDELKGEDDNEWLYLGWSVEGLDYSITFIEEPQDIFFDGSTITMLDSEDYETRLTLLTVYIEPTFDVD